MKHTVRILSEYIVADNTENLFGYTAWPSICHSDNGELLCVYSGNRLGHICPFGKVILRRSGDEGESWSTQEIVIDTPLDDRDAGITLLRDGKLLVTSFNNTRAEQRNWAKHNPNPAFRQMVESYCDMITDEQEQDWYGALAAISDDDGYEWSIPFHTPVSSPHGVMQGSDNLIYYVGTIAPDQPQDEEFPIRVYTSFDGREWTPLAKIPRCPEYKDCGHYEPHMAEIGGRLVTAIRVEDGVFTVAVCTSDDHGKTWTVPRPTGANGSPPHLLAHSSGKLIMTYGRRCEPFGIEVMVSEDRGDTWSEPMTLWEEGPGPDLGYPCSVELEDGSIYTVYYGQLEDDARCSILATRWTLD